MAKYARHKVWDGEMLHDVSELCRVAGGIKWYGPGVGQGWVDIDPIFEWEDEPKPKTDLLLEVVDEFSY